MKRLLALLILLTFSSCSLNLNIPPPVISLVKEEPSAGMEKKVEREAGEENPKPAPAVEDVAKSTEQEGPARTMDWRTYILSGCPFQVIFDSTADKFDDSVYTGDYKTDPMGTLKGGETYTVVYEDGKFSCTGFNQGAGRTGTWTYENADPSRRVISLWGRCYTFDEQGNVTDPQYGRVGSLSPGCNKH
ncbi:MAG: hypothetical protein AB1921_16520 [Thermodesulfobacteriota bacterium]